MTYYECYFMYQGLLDGHSIKAVKRKGIWLEKDKDFAECRMSNKDLITQYLQKIALEVVFYTFPCAISL